jgi:hypothetical protein
MDGWMKLKAVVVPVVGADQCEIQTVAPCYLKSGCCYYLGTSGDTGSSAIEAVSGMKWVDIVVVLPRNRCTKIQELQMTTVKADNVFVYRGR